MGVARVREFDGENAKALKAIKKNSYQIVLSVLDVYGPR